VTEPQTLDVGAAEQIEDDDDSQLSEYTTETTDEDASRRVVARPVVTGRALGTGRRKEAIARVRIAPGTGQWKINDRSLEQFFPNKVHQQLISEPLVTLGAEGQFDVIARVSGGGVTGQAGALRLGIARALTIVDPENRATLKRAGFLTRDARVKERKKYGLKKARKAPQYSKR
jgi:small subunit ribosomal protein S9